VGWYSNRRSVLLSECDMITVHHLNNSRYQRDPKTKLPPPGSPERLRYTCWLHFAEGTAMPPMVMKLVFDRIENAPMPFFAKPVAHGILQKVKRGFIDPNLQRITAHMEAELGRGEWFAGDKFSAADIQMNFPIQAVLSRARGGSART